MSNGFDDQLLKVYPPLHYDLLQKSLKKEKKKGYNTEIMTVDHSGQCGWIVPCSLLAKIYFVEFEKRVGAL